MGGEGVALVGAGDHDGGDMGFGVDGVGEGGEGRCGSHFVFCFLWCSLEEEMTLVLLLFRPEMR